MSAKRRNLTRWMVNRLRRLDAKLAAPVTPVSSAYCDTSSESLARCLTRAHRLACDVQIAWGKEAAAKTRASL